MPSTKWQQHVLCTQLIRRHPDWTDQQVLEEARMHPLEIGIVAEARREVDGEAIRSNVQSQRSF